MQGAAGVHRGREKTPCLGLGEPLGEDIRLNEYEDAVDNPDKEHVPP